MKFRIRTETRNRAPRAAGDAKSSSFRPKGTPANVMLRTGALATIGPKGPDATRAIVPPRKSASPGAARDHISSPLIRPRASGHRDVRTPIKPADRLGCLRKVKLCTEL